MPHDLEVVVTGMGVVSAFGVGSEALWENVSAGKSGINWISSFDVSDWQVRFAGEVRDFRPEDHLKKHCPAKRDRGVQMGLVSAAGALEQAGFLNGKPEVDTDIPVGVVMGSGLGPCFEAEFSYGCYYERGRKAVRPTTVPRSMFNSLSSNLSIYFGLRGTNYVIASACASGTSAIGHAYLLIKSGVENVVLCGGADSPLCPSMFAAWTNMNVLSRREPPHTASRPFDRDRDGLVLSEGAAMLVLESREHAERRGANILARVVGFGASSDAHHITAPSTEGQVLAMRRCLADAGLEPENVDYVNAHGTGTKANDSAEAEAIREVFGSRGSSLPVTSTKSMLGHSLGASGAIEFIVCVESMRRGFVTPTLNCDDPDPEIGLDYVPRRGRPQQIVTAMSNSFAFGGNNAAILLRRFDS